MDSPRPIQLVRVAVVALVVASLCVVPGFSPTASAAPADPIVGIASTPTGLGYWLARSDGSVFAFGDATPRGSMAGQPLNAPIVGIASTPTGQGYWLLGRDGGIFSFGDAKFYGSTGSTRLNAPVKALAPTPSGKGYWLIASDGGIFSFGDAKFLGSMGGTRLNAPVIGGASVASGLGYWLVAADGGVFSFGDAQFLGSTGSIRLNQPVVSMSTDPLGRGYRFIAADGGVFNYGTPVYGSGVGKVAEPVTGMAIRPQGDGYWLVTERGNVVAIGQAPVLGSLSGIALSSVAVTATAAFTGLSGPTALTNRPGTSDMYVTEKAGRVMMIRNGAVNPAPMLAIDPGAITASGERGLLDLTFNANGSKLYLYLTIADGDVSVVEYTMTPGASGSVDASSRRALLTIEHSARTNHNGGHVEFGPDGRLWISVGDGGGGGDPDGNAQNTAVLLGKMLRIDPTPSAGRPYTVPLDNPFVGQAGKAAEIAAYGLRNPWRFTFDRLTGDLWIADVGQGQREEIDLDLAVPDLGANYGWPLYEGSQRYSGDNPPGAVLPLLDYGHGAGDCSISGGVVYRSPAMPALDGVYVYGDFCTGRIGAVRQRSGAVVDAADRLATVSGVVSFNQGTGGELYAVSTSGTIWRLIAR